MDQILGQTKKQENNLPDNEAILMKRRRRGLALDTGAMQKLAAFASLILLMIFFSFASPYFFGWENIITVIKQTAVIGIIAIGVTFVIITAGIDLSLGSVVAVAGVTAAMVLRTGMPTVVGIFVGLATGLACGLFCGFLVGKGLPPFIATLGMMMIARGFALVLTLGLPVYFMENKEVGAIHNTDLFGFIPIPVIYLFVIAYIAYFILKKCSIGRYIYAVGSNEEAAKLSGLSVSKIKIFVYGFSGLMCGISGVILLARLNSGQPSTGYMYELDAIAAAVIGGTSLSGGEGTIVGTIIGALIMSVLKNGLNLMHVSQFWQWVIIGFVVIVAVFIDIARKKK